MITEKINILPNFQVPYFNIWWILSCFQVGNTAGMDKPTNSCIKRQRLLHQALEFAKVAVPWRTTNFFRLIQVRIKVVKCSVWTHYTVTNNLFIGIVQMLCLNKRYYNLCSVPYLYCSPISVPHMHLKRRYFCRVKMFSKKKIWMTLYL